jgi:hypothetical protein
MRSGTDTASMRSGMDTASMQPMDTSSMRSDSSSTQR